MAEDILRKVEFEDETQWSVKRIAIGLVLLFIVGVAVYTYWQDLPQESSKVQGVSTEEKKSSPINYSPQIIQENVQKNVNELKNQVNNLNAAEIATSSPQVQKIIKDLQALQDYPKNQAKEACMKICNNF